MIRQAIPVESLPENLVVLLQVSRLAIHQGNQVWNLLGSLVVSHQANPVENRQTNPAPNHQDSLVEIPQ